jgi:hypothetical protein
VREPLWQRVRRRKNSDEANRPIGVKPSGGTSPTASPAETSSSVDVESTFPSLGDLGDVGDKRAEYADWAERMKVKRAEKVDRVRELSDDKGDADGPTYWSADAVWEESRRLEDEGTSLVVTRVEHLAVLGLGGDATQEEVVSMYRRKAKEHHPDRFPDADEATRAYHVEQMQRISSAYRALQPDPRA